MFTTAIRYVSIYNLVCYDPQVPPCQCELPVVEFSYGHTGWSELYAVYKIVKQRSWSTYRHLDSEPATGPQ